MTKQDRKGWVKIAQQKHEPKERGHSDSFIRYNRSKSKKKKIIGVKRETT